jgi:hypothetical protein
MELFTGPEPVYFTQVCELGIIDFLITGFVIGILCKRPDAYFN